MQAMIKSLKNVPLFWPAVVIIVVGYVGFTFLFRAIGYSAVKNSDQINELIKGNTLKGETFSFYYSPDGKVYGKIGFHNDWGSWFVENGVYCEQWAVWGRGEKLCWSIEQNGEFIKREGRNIPPYSEIPVVNELIWIEGEI